MLRSVSFAVLVLYSMASFGGSSLQAEIQLIGMFSFAGTDSDRSQLNGKLPTGEPHNQLGGFSAIEYLGANRYLVLSDRGPNDGAVRFRCRWHEFELPIESLATSQSGAKLLSTTCLSDQQDRALTGYSAAIEGVQASDEFRFDPEGVRALGQKIFVSEEYGPQLLEFSLAGRQIRQIPLPPRFLIQHPSASPAEENSGNNVGRQSNRGPEGLAITPNGRMLVAAMQGPLIQDAKRLPDGKLTGIFARLVAIDLSSLVTRVFAYPLEDATTGISEILAVNDHEFLVLERDSTVGAAAKFKRIIRIDLSAATDISAVESLPQAALPAGIQPVRKSTFIDLLDPKFQLAGERFPEKQEGLAFGPRLKDGRLSLLVTIDNDFESGQKSLIYCFAITSDELPNFSWQR